MATAAKSAASDGRSSLLRSGAAYTVASAAPRAVGFLLLPLFTKVLSPADYGQLSVALSVNAVASIVFALGFDVAVFRGLFQLAHDPDARSRFMHSTWTFLMVAPMFMAIFCAAIGAPLLGSSKVLSAGRLALSLIAAALYVGSTIVPLTVLRAENRVREYMLLTAIVTLTTTCLTVSFVVWLHTGVTGWLSAIMIANAAGFVAATQIIPYRRPRGFDVGAVRGTLRLSLPVVPHFAALWALQLADRVLVASLLSLGAAGVYSLASNLALPMYMIVIGFGQAFMPDYAKAGQAGHKQDGLQRTMALQTAVVAALCTACALLGPAAVHVLDGRYSSAAALVPWLVLGYGFLGLYAMPMNGLTLTHGRTKGLAIVSGLGAATNIGLIVGLAPAYGVEAVAIASAVGYGVLLACVLLFARYRRATLQYPWQTITAVLIVGAIGYAGGALSSGDASAMDVLVRVAWVIATTLAIGLVTIGRAPLSRLRPEEARSA